MNSMSTRRRPRHVLATIAATVVLPLALTACGDAAEKVGEKAAEKAAEKAIEDGGSGDVDVDGDRVKIETSEGTLEAGQGLPADFPDEVPIVGDDPAGGAAQVSGKTTWTVVTHHDVDASDALAAAASALEDAGFTGQPESVTVGDASYRSFENDRFLVVVFTDPGNPDGSTMSYTVTAK